MVKLKSNLGLKKAKKLLDLAVAEKNLKPKEIAFVDYVAKYPFEETDDLLEKGLIKLVKTVSRFGYQGVTPPLPRQPKPFIRKPEPLPEEEKEDAKQIIGEMDFEGTPSVEAPEPPEEISAEEPEEMQFELSEESEEDAEDMEFELADDEEDEEEEMEFELADEEEEEEVEFMLADESESDEEEVEFELADDGGSDEEDEDVVFELAEEEGSEEPAPAPQIGGDITAEDPALRERMVTLKKYVRGFLAKMKQGDPERKTVYTEIKAKILAMSGVKTRASFSGETFYRGRVNLVKTRVRGKTLCLFLALDVDAYKQTVYHHQYKGDVKAYEDTPMMIRVKTELGLQKALYLIDEVGRRFGLPVVCEPDKKKIRREFNYAETGELLEKGLIKSRLVSVPYYEAQELLKKKK